MYVEYHDHFSNEVYQATACYVIWKNLQNQPAEDSDLLKCLNVNALSWVFIRHSMMVSLIMALGRVFDTNGESVSVDDLIKSCITDIDLFTKSSLRERKSKSHNASEWIDSYMETTYEPSESDFQRLKPQIKKYRDVFNNYYKPIRHKIFAHSDKQSFTQTNELWSATKGANIEDMLNFLEDLKITLQEAYQNGRKPELKGRKIDEEWFAKDIQSLLQRVKNA